ncbi:hypothetical protein FRC17_010748, partial [Serendipita sp. 399]
MSELGDSSSAEDHFTIFQQDEASECTFSISGPVPQYYEPILSGPVVPTQYHLYPATFPEIEEQTQNLLYCPYMSPSSVFPVDLGHDTLKYPATGEDHVPGESKSAETQATISPSLLLNNSPDRNISPPVSPSDTEPGTAQGRDVPLSSSENNSVSPILGAAPGRYAFLPRPPDLSKKRRRPHTAGGQHVVLVPITPYQSTGSSLDMDIGPATTNRSTDREHAFSTLITSPPQAARTNNDGGTSPLHSTEAISPTDTTQIQPWL